MSASPGSYGTGTITRIFLFIFLLFPVNLYPQPQNWVHFFQEGDLNDPMSTIVADIDATIYTTNNRTNKTLFKLSIDSNFNCQTNLVPFTSFRQSLDNCYFIHSIDGNCIYLFTPDSICRIDENNPGVKSTVVKLSERQIFLSSLEVHNIGIYASSTGGSVYLFKNNTLSLLGRPLDSTDVYPQCMDSQNRLWFSTMQKGLMYYKDANWTFFTTGNSKLASNSFMSDMSSILFETADHKIIAGSFDSGLQVFDGTIWKPFSPQPPEESQRHIRCCARDSSAAIWVGSNAGTLRYYNNQWYLYTQQDYYTHHAPFNYTIDVVVDKKNRVWFSMAHDGIFMLDQSPTPSLCHTIKKLSFTSPVKNDVIRSGTKDTISWNSYGNIDSVTLYYKTDPDGEWTKVLSNQFSFERSLIYWTIPTTISNNYYLRIRDYEDSTVQNIVGPFSVVAEGTNITPSLLSIPETLTVKKNQLAALTVRAADPNGDSLTFRFGNLPSWVTAHDSVLTFQPDDKSTSFTFVVTVTDGRGGADSVSVHVTVEPSVGTIPAIRKGCNISFYLRKSNEGLTLEPNGAASAIRQATLYDLSGRCIGILQRRGYRFSLNCRGASFGKNIFILKIDFFSSEKRQTLFQPIIAD